jgi:hypothetical protein
MITKVLIRNNIVIAILDFENNNDIFILEELEKKEYKYDQIITLNNNISRPNINDIWDGKKFEKVNTINVLETDYPTKK